MHSKKAELNIYLRTAMRFSSRTSQFAKKLGKT